MVFKEGNCQCDKYIPWISSIVPPPDLSVSCIKPANTGNIGNSLVFLCVIRPLILSQGIIPVLENIYTCEHRYFKMIPFV